MNLRKLNISLIISLAILIMACADVYLPIKSRSFAHMYNPSLTDIHPNLLLYRVSKNTSVLFVRIPTSEIDYPKFGNQNYKPALIETTLYMIDSVGANNFSDSIIKNIRFESKPATYYVQFKLLLHHSENIQFLELYLRDVNSGSKTSEIIPIMKDSRQNPQRYYMYYTNKEYPFAKRFIKQNDSIKIHTSVTTKNLYVFHLTQNTLDSLPFDTVYKTPANQFINFYQSGAYVINADSTIFGGHQIKIENKYFPAIKTAEQMLPPIKLLTNNDEWKWLNKFNKKKAVDTFWLKSAPRPEQAKKQIQVFYNRIQHANIKFTSQRAGWQTQPGLIMLLTGLPDEVIWTDDGQNWYYFIGDNDKLQIPFKYNDKNQELELQRNDSIINGFLLHYINRWRNGNY